MADNTPTNAGSGGDTIATDELVTLNGAASSGVKVQRVKNTFGDDGDSRDVSATFPMPTFNQHNGREFISLYATNVTAPATGTTALVTLSIARTPGTAPTTGTSFNVPAGKRFRITSVLVAQRGNATATAAVITHAIVVNAAGAVATNSAVWQARRTATPATALAWDRVESSIGDDGVEIVGGANVNIGATVNPVFTTNAPTYDVHIQGYLY